MNYRAALDYLYSLQRFGIKLGLDNIRNLLERLAYPDRSFRCVHVAGTNGKGSVCAATAAILQRSGYRVGLYTSPHLHCFGERIRVDGQMIENGEVARLTEEIRTLSADIPTTFFEFTTALALLYFQRRGVDWVVLETGMGGRLDATNVVAPALSVITPIARDHAEHLGSSLSLIACEKGGIIKPGIPVVIGRQPRAALDPLLEIARRRHSPVFLFARDFHVRSAAETFDYQGGDLRLGGVRPALLGVHQKENLATALATAEMLRRQGVRLSAEAMRGGVEQVTWPGRLEWFSNPPLLLDGAHNRAGAEVLAAYLKTIETGGIHWVLGVKASKDARALMEPLLPLVRSVYCTRPPVDEACEPARLREIARRAGISGQIHETPAAALEAARIRCGPKEMILVAGSLFLVAEIRGILLRQQKVSA